MSVCVTEMPARWKRRRTLRLLEGEFGRSQSNLVADCQHRVVDFLAVDVSAVAAVGVVDLPGIVAEGDDRVDPRAKRIGQHDGALQAPAEAIVLQRIEQVIRTGPAAADHVQVAVHGSSCPGPWVTQPIQRWQAGIGGWGNMKKRQPLAVAGQSDGLPSAFVSSISREKSGRRPRQLDRRRLIRHQQPKPSVMTDRSTSGDFDALLVIGHGTRDPAGLAEFQTLLERIARRRPDWHVAGCYLELAEPSIESAVDRLAAAGRTRIRAMPLVLFSAGHAKRDIPAALARATERNPGVEIGLCQALDCHQQIVELSAERFQQALARQAGLAGTPVAADETLLILVGRGGSDSEAVDGLRRLAELRRLAAVADGQSPVGRVEVAFAAVAEPALATVLERAAQSHFRRVVVQPHLLFAGNVLADIRRLVDRQRTAPAGRHADGGNQTAENRETSPRQWIVTGVLGPDERLVTAVIDRVSQSAGPVDRLASIRTIGLLATL